MICDANMASPSYLSAKMEVVLPAGIPVIRMQTLTSVESSGNGFSTSQISRGKNTSRKQVYHSTDLENRDRIGASARIVPITIMERGTVQPLVMSMASSKKFGKRDRSYHQNQAHKYRDDAGMPHQFPEGIFFC